MGTMARYIFLFVLCCFVSAQTASSPAGRWVSNLKYFENDNYDRLQFELNGNKLTGKLGNDNFEGTFQNGRIEGTVKQGPQESTKFVGVLKGDRIEGTTGFGNLDPHFQVTFTHHAGVTDGEYAIETGLRERLPPRATGFYGASGFEGNFLHSEFAVCFNRISSRASCCPSLNLFIERLGERTLIYADLRDGSTVVYDEPGDVRLDIGQPVRLAFDGAAAHMFGPDGMTLRG